MDDLDVLVGETITRIYVKDNQSILVFAVDDGRLVVIHAEGDCCSESWFADFYGIQNIIGSPITKVKSISMDGYDCGDGRCRQEVDKAYGFTIYTEQGMAAVAMRNSSNGFYGGWFDFEPVDWMIDDIVIEEFLDLTDKKDWSA